MGAVRPCSGPCAAPGRPPRGQSGHRASRPNPAGRPWAHGGASTVRIELRARSARKVNVCIPRAFATSPTDQRQRGGRVSAACPVESGCRATPPGLRLALHRNHHVAPRVSMTLRSVWCTTSKLRVQAAPSLLEPARTTYSSEPSRFSAWESVFRLRSITSATPVHRGAPSGQTRPADGCRGGGCPPKCEPFALEPPGPTLRPAQCCFAARERVR